MIANPGLQPEHEQLYYQALEPEAAERIGFLMARSRARVRRLAHFTAGEASR
jgi:hypothetical protein